MAFALAPPERVLRGSLDVSIALSERWLKPLRPVDVAVEAPAEATVAWFVELAEVLNASADASGSSASRPAVEPRSTTVEGDIFVLKSTTPDHHNTDGPRSPVEIPELVADGRARSVKLATPGRYTLEGDGAQLLLNVWPGAPESAAQAFLVEEGDALRFEPPELDVRPGTRVLLWSQAPRALELVETRFAAFVPLDAREGRITPIDEGLYRLLALAVRGDARGIASAAMLVDFERPSDRLVVGPVQGELLVAEGGSDEPPGIRFRAQHELESLVVRFAAGSNLPAPASILVSLLHEGELLAEASSLTEDEIELFELPAGKYTIEVRGEHGALVGYEVGAEGRYRLPTPERLRESTR